MLAWGVLAGLIILAIAVIGFMQAGPETPAPQDTVVRNVNVAVTPAVIRTGTSTTVSVVARDGEGALLPAWESARLEAWLVRSDLTYAQHVAVTDTGSTSTFRAQLRPSQPGWYRLTATGVRDNLLTLGGTTLTVAGTPEDVAPEEQSAGREGYKVVLSTIPDTAKLHADEPVAVTFSVSRTGAPVPLDETNGFRGSLVAFREDGSIFVHGEPHASAYLPSPSSAAFTLTLPQPGRYRLFFAFQTGGTPLMEARWIEVQPAR